MVVRRLEDYLSFEFKAVDVARLTDARILEEYELLLFFAPTYGDGELQQDMEDFLQRLDQALPDKHFAVCELGNYYGYDDFAHGAMPIIRDALLELKAKELIAPVSIDSLPKKDWENLKRWCDLLNQVVADE